MLLTGYFCIGTVIDVRVAVLDPKPKESIFYTTDRESITGPVQKQLVHNSFIRTFWFFDFDSKLSENYREQDTFVFSKSR